MRLEQAGTPIGGNDLLISVRLADVFGWQRPFGSYLMVNVTVGGESDPDIDIRQVDHRS
jgi:hypothetical protein